MGSGAASAENLHLLLYLPDSDISRAVSHFFDNSGTLQDGEKSHAQRHSNHEIKILDGCLSKRSSYRNR